MPELKPAIVKRIRRNGGNPPGRHGTCLICGKGWDDCPHDMGQIDTLLQMYRQQELAKMVCYAD